MRLEGRWYCRTECLEHAVVEHLAPAHPAPLRWRTAHRIPLGLLLLSREQLSAAQLQTALAAQRAAGQGRIGEWLRQLGFVTEREITAALARQWCCPVLRRSPLPATAVPGLVPMRLLEAFQMIPVEFVEASRVLHVAFSEGIDYVVLYAIEQMLGCRTEPCLVVPSALRQGLEVLAQRSRPSEFAFDRVDDSGECARIISNYATRTGATQVRMVSCGEYVWVRLERPGGASVDLLLHLGVPGLWHHSPR